MRIAGPILLLLAAAAPAISQQPRPLTQADLRDLSDEQLSRRLFGDIGAIMFPIRYRADAGEARTPIRALQFMSRPRVSHRAGICETDRVTVHFELAPLPLVDGVQPRRFELSTNYFVQDAALARQHRPPDLEDGRERFGLDSACAAVDPRQANISVAGDAHDVATAVVLVSDLAAAARSGRIAIPVECRERGGESVPEAECRAELARLDPSEPMYVQHIAGCYRSDPAVYCRRIEFFQRSEGRSFLFEFPIAGREPARVTVESIPPDQF
jgi:hypothetical protein